MDAAADLTFVWANRLILVFWALLAVLPRHPLTQRLVHAPWAVLAIAATYLVFSLNSFLGGPLPEGGGFGTLEEVMVLFSSKPAVMAGWLHYLAFDLFIGAWQVRDSRRLGIPHLWVVPCLLFTLALGPLGLALYCLLRLVRTGRSGFEERTQSA